MSSIDAAGVQLASSRFDFPAPDAETAAMMEIGLIDLGHVHHCCGLTIRLAGCSQVESAQLNPTFSYWIAQDTDSWWVVTSSLGAGNVVGYVDQISGIKLAQGECYVVEHAEPHDGACSMVIRRDASA